MENLLSDRIKNTPSSFIRAIFTKAATEGVISFAGGLPNPISFPSEELKISSARIIDKYGSKVFQYSTTPGIIELREFIAKRYNEKFNLNLTYENVLITTGSSQALDLISKVLLNKNDNIIVEKPTFLGALQVFSQYGPNFLPVELEEDGLNLDELKKAVLKNPKFLYAIPDFQNPTGLSYSKEKRDEIFKILKDTKTVFIEDDPYGELRFEDEHLPYIGLSRLENGLVLGSFSKTISPGMRVGYVLCENKEFLSFISKAKEASDLHTSVFNQYLLFDYLTNNDFDAHISKIKNLYKTQAKTMINAMEKYFPKNVKFTKPKGGMFLWVELLDGIKTTDLFDRAIENGVAFVPGEPFYAGSKVENTMRLNYTNANNETIEKGIKILGKLLGEIKA